MIYKKYEGVIPYNVGDTVEFKQLLGDKFVPRRGVIKRIDEFGYGYNIHIKYEDIDHTKYSTIIYPLKESVIKIEI